MDDEPVAPQKCNQRNTMGLSMAFRLGWKQQSPNPIHGQARQRRRSLGNGSSLDHLCAVILGKGCNFGDALAANSFTLTPVRTVDQTREILVLLACDALSRRPI
eukprot:5427280-Amphidinium_carterae.1